MSIFTVNHQVSRNKSTHVFVNGMMHKLLKVYMMCLVIIIYDSLSYSKKSSGGARCSQ